MHSSPKKYSQLQPKDRRVTLAGLKQQGYSVRTMARHLNRLLATTLKAKDRQKVSSFPVLVR